MNKLKLTRKQFNNVSANLFLLLCVYAMIELLGWGISYRTKFNLYKQFDGPVTYAKAIITQMYIPEIVTLFFVNRLFYYWHQVLKIESISLTPKGIFRYEAGFVIPILFAFFIYDPFTQWVRYITEQVIFHNTHYSFAVYLKTYFLATYKVRFYFVYLLPSAIIGYTVLNYSLILDYIAHRDSEALQALEMNEKAKKTVEEVIQKVTELGHNQAKELILKGRNKVGENTFSAADVLYFTIHDKVTTAVLLHESYSLSKSLNDLEEELGSQTFFRIKRDYIVNRSAVLDYAYWEKGKSVVRLKTDPIYEIIVPRARMQVFKEWQLDGTKGMDKVSDFLPKPDNLLFFSGLPSAESTARIN